MPHNIITGLLLLLLTTVAMAEPTDELPWYEVEIIIFKNLNSSYADSEYWPETSAIDATQNSIELVAYTAPVTLGPGTPVETGPVTPPVSASAADERPYQILDSESYQLNALKLQMSRHSQYRVLSHVAWRQPVIERGKAIAIHLHSDMNTPQPEFVDESLSIDSNNIDSQFVSPLANTDNTDTSEDAELFDGTLTIGISRYLHADINLYFTESDDVEVVTEAATVNFSGTADSVPSVYVLNESRRMRSKKLHYFDHPAYGVMLLITPYEKPINLIDESTPAITTVPAAQPVEN